MSRPAVLYFSPPGNKRANKTRALIARLGVRLINVSESDINKTIEELIGQQEAGEISFGKDLEQAVHSPGGSEDKTDLPSSIEEEMMVFFNFTESAFDRVLRELKKSHATVSLKAVATQTNLKWPFIKLYGEISCEREYIKRSGSSGT